MGAVIAACPELCQYATQEWADNLHGTLSLKYLIFSYGGDASRSAKARVSINNDSPALCVDQACYRVVESKSEESKEERRASQRRASQRGESTAAWQAGLQLPNSRSNQFKTVDSKDLERLYNRLVVRLFVCSSRSPDEILQAPPHLPVQTSPVLHGQFTSDPQYFYRFRTPYVLTLRGAD